jgi:hypothetical protein
LNATFTALCRRSTTSADRPRDDREQHRRRVGEDEAEHERQLAQREDVDVAPDRDVHDARLGGGEAERDHPPGRARPGAQGFEVADVGERQRERAGGHRGDERPHARRAARAQAEKARAQGGARRAAGALDTPMCDAAAYGGHSDSIGSPVVRPRYTYR